MDSVHLKESERLLNYGIMQLKMKTHFEDVRASVRQGLEVALKISRGTEQSISILDQVTNLELLLLLLHEKGRPPSEWISLPSGGREPAPGFCCTPYGHELAKFPPSWIMARARAQYYLGCDYFLQGKPEEASEMLQNGLRTLEAEPELPSPDATGLNWWRILSADIHSKLGRVQYASTQYEEAAKHFHRSAQLHYSLEAKVWEGKLQASALSNFGDFATAVKVLEEILLWVSTDSDLLTARDEVLGLKAMLEYRKGLSDFRSQDIEGSIIYLEKARKSFVEAYKLEKKDLAGLRIQVHLLQSYIAKHDFWSAFRLVSDFHPIMEKYYKADPIWIEWQVMIGNLHYLIGDLRSADEVIFQSQLDFVQGFTNETSSWLRADLVRTEDPELALELYTQMENVIKGSEEEVSLPRIVGLSETKASWPAVRLAQIQLGRAETLVEMKFERVENSVVDHRSIPSLERACDESQQAIDSLRQEASRDCPTYGQGILVMLARALACKAVALRKLKYVNLFFVKDEKKDPTQLGLELEKLIDEAIQLIQNQACNLPANRKLLARFKHIKATISLSQDDQRTAEREGHEAALIFAELQLGLKNLDSAWVNMLDSEMKRLLIFMEDLSLKGNNPVKALLWAERGRMRLFQYHIEQLGRTDFPNVKRATVDIPDEHPDALDLYHLTLNPSEVLQQGPGQVPSSNQESPGKSGGKGCTGTVHGSSTELEAESPKGTYDNGTVRHIEKLRGLKELWFDGDDALAEKYLCQTVGKFGRGALILEYTFVKEPFAHLLIYIVFVDSGDSGDRLVVRCQDVIIVDGERNKREWPWGSTVETMIYKTRQFIFEKKDDKAMEGLSLLHSLLIKPVQQFVNAFPRLILAVHEELALVPFAALYNKESRTFLMQEKIISYIPSIRALDYCFDRQWEFEQAMQKGLLDPPFVAGNPKPMGRNMADLPEAAEEAKLVAKILNVDPCIGHDMTKEKVKAGFSKGSMVLLATHGIVDDDFPHGALVLQGRHDKNSSSRKDVENSSSSLASTSTSHLSGHIFPGQKNVAIGNDDDDAVFTADELAMLPGGIRAGLVVLSACESGLGERTSEGVLGLGRSLLQAGAPVTMLTLWKVGDSSNKVLITGVFEQLVNQDKDVAKAVHLTMMQMMESKEKKYNIFHWAPLVVIGSPNFKYSSRVMSIRIRP